MLRLCLVALTFVFANISAAFANAKYASLVVDSKTGKVLHAENADAHRYPASITKVMTLYMLFEQLESGRLKLTTPLHVSAEAASQPPTKLGLRAGQTITVEDALRGLITKSANDASVVIAEAIGDDEDEFARLMTQKARSLGMTRTTFKNASGLPDPGQVTTARDLVTLGRAIQDRFPKYYRYFSTYSFAYRGISHRNHNRLLGRFEGVDGIKTGYTRASGFNLLSSVKRQDKHVVAVVLGGTSSHSRDLRMKSLVADNMMRATSGTRTAPMLAEMKPLQEKTSKAIAKLSPPTPMEQTVAMVSQSAPMPQEKPSSKPLQMNKPILSAKPKGEFSIQIGAFPVEASAKEALNLAKNQVRALADFDPYTEEVQRGSGSLVRARFAGFVDKAQAEKACSSLKKQDFACIAVPN